MWQRAPPGVGHPQLHLKMVPPAGESTGGSLLGGQEVAVAGPHLALWTPPSSLQCPVLGLLPFVSILPPLYLGCLIPNWSGAMFCLFLVSCLRFPLKSEPLQEVSLGLSAALCPLLVPTLGQDSGLLRFLPPCPARPMAPAVGGVGLTFQLASALACSHGPWVSSLI